MGGYDTHQRLRTKAVRQLKKKDYAAAIESLYGGAVELLKEGEQGSGCDLGVYMLDVYSQGDVKSDETSRARIVEIVRLSKPDFWRKKVIDAATKWSAKVSGLPSGDGHLRLALGEVLAAEGSYYASEQHLLLASIPPPGNPTATATYFNKEAPVKLASMQIQWLKAHAQAGKQAGDKRDEDTLIRLEAGRWALRGLLPLLLSRALTSSRTFLSTYLAQLMPTQPKLLLPVTPNPKPYAPPAGTGPRDTSATQQQLYLTANADLNFAQMMLALVGQAVSVKKSAQPIPDALKSAWGNLVGQFEREGGAIQTDEYIDEAINPLSALYFDIKPARQQGNFMQDMMGALMGGGGPGAAAGSAPAPPPLKQAPPPAPIAGGKAVEEPKEEEGELDLD